jgi:hypothetical protein
MYGKKIFSNFGNMKGIVKNKQAFSSIDRS